MPAEFYNTFFALPPGPGSWRGHFVCPHGVRLKGFERDGAAVSAPERSPTLTPDSLLPGHAKNDAQQDRKSTRLNSSHGYISYAVFCLKKKKKQERVSS